MRCRFALDAAHLRPKEDDGSDDPRNGLVFCPTHHRAFDSGLFAIEPVTLRLACREGGPDAARLGIKRPAIDPLARAPHPDAVRWRWDRWRG
jgi:putative restriction endonuclease